MPPLFRGGGAGPAPPPPPGQRAGRRAGQGGAPPCRRITQVECRRGQLQEPARAARDERTWSKRSDRGRPPGGRAEREEASRSIRGRPPREAGALQTDAPVPRRWRPQRPLRRSARREPLLQAPGGTRRLAGSEPPDGRARRRRQPHEGERGPSELTSHAPKRRGERLRLRRRAQGQGDDAQLLRRRGPRCWPTAGARTCALAEASGGEHFSRRPHRGAA